MNTKESFQCLQIKGTQTYGSIIICPSVSRFPRLGNENYPKYSPAPWDIKEPEISVVDGKQPRENYLLPVLNVTRDNTIRRFYASTVVPPQGPVRSLYSIFKFPFLVLQIDHTPVAFALLKGLLLDRCRSSISSLNLGGFRLPQWAADYVSVALSTSKRVITVGGRGKAPTQFLFKMVQLVFLLSERSSFVSIMKVMYLWSEKEYSRHTNPRLLDKSELTRVMSRTSFLFEVVKFVSSSRLTITMLLLIIKSKRYSPLSLVPELPHISVSHPPPVDQWSPERKEPTFILQMR